MASECHFSQHSCGSEEHYIRFRDLFSSDKRSEIALLFFD